MGVGCRTTIYQLAIFVNFAVTAWIRSSPFKVVGDAEAANKIGSEPGSTSPQTGPAAETEPAVAVWRKSRCFGIGRQEALRRISSVTPFSPSQTGSPVYSPP
jgi:hypothetical protein